MFSHAANEQIKSIGSDTHPMNQLLRTRTCVYNKNDDLQDLKDIINRDKQESE